MTDILIAAALGLVQGLTEFLPISSTAHLIIAEKLFSLDPARFGLSFDIAIHLGTALAVLLYFAGTWIGLFRDVLARRWHLPLLIAAGTVPAVVAGVLFQSLVARELRDIRIVAGALALGSLLFYLAERWASQRRGAEGLGWADAALMGSAQAIALIPGVSRSGITISAGLFLGLRREEATRFSFLLAMPVIAGAGAKTLLDVERAAELFARPEVTIAGFVVSFLAGLGAVAFLMRFLRAHSLNWFIPYRLALAALLLLVTAMGVA